MTELINKQPNSKIINSAFSSNVNAQKYIKEALKRAEKEIDKVEQDIKNLEDND